MKHTLAMARQVQAAEAQAELAVENNRLLRLICAKLDIPVDEAPAPVGEEEPATEETQAETESKSPAVEKAPTGKDKK